MSSDKDDFGKKSSYNSGQQDPGEQLKKKIFSTIEGFMDQAMTEWNKVPAEKKERMFRKMKNHGWFEDTEHGEIHMKRRLKYQKKGKDEIAVGVAATIGFGAAFMMTHLWFLLFPLIFVGLIPLSVGVSKLFRKKVLSEGKPASGPQQKIQSEKEILRLAKEQGGKFTVLQVASETSLSIEEARDALDSMVKKGYIQLQVMDSGILRYEIPEFFPEPEKDDIEKKIDELKDR